MISPVKTCQFLVSANPMASTALHSRVESLSWRQSQAPLEAPQDPRAHTLWKVTALFVSLAIY
jgi:hypothetical protein